MSPAKLFSVNTSFFSIVKNITESADSLNKDLQNKSNDTYQWKMYFSLDISKQAQKVDSSRKKHKYTHPRVLTSSERWCLTLFSQLALISQLCLCNFEGNRKYHPNAFLLCSLVKTCFAASCYTICASTNDGSFTAIMTLCVRPCLLCCFSRKCPSEVPSDIGYLSKIHSSKDHNKKLFLYVIQPFLS